MDTLETTLRHLAVSLSHLLDPVSVALDQLGVWIRLRLEAAGVPHAWHAAILTALWVLVTVMVVRSLSGWLRLVAMVVVALLLTKVYGMLPGA